jgi:dTDP-L-rhamnose 4-epimerase
MSELGHVLVTGGAGFIGCSIANALAHGAERWVALDSLHAQVHSDRTRPKGLSDGAEFVLGDVTSPSDWDALLEQFKPDTVVHLAAETGTAQSLDEATRHAWVNAVGTTAMIDAFGRHQLVPERFILSSSRAVYGEGEWIDADGLAFHPGIRSHSQLASKEWDFPDARPIASASNRTAPSPTSIYGATKLVQENILSAWAGARGAQLTILRLQNVYGPGQSLINPYTGIVSLFSRIAAHGEAIPVYEDGKVTRDFVYIDDVAAAFAAVLRSTQSADVENYDVGSGQASTILELATEIAKYHGAPEPTLTGLFRDGDVRYAACEIAQAEGALGWSPRWNLQQGVASLQEWIAKESQ